MTEEADKHIFSADRPIRTREEDLLGRRSFAESIAQAIAGWAGEESLVVGIYGPWGSGKSSVKNMILDALRDPEFAGGRAPITVEYNPWQFAGQKQLTEGFFEEVAAALGQQGQEKRIRKLAVAFKEYGRRLAVATHGLQGIRSVVKWAALAMLVLSGSGIGLSWGWTKWAILVLALILGVFGWFGGLFEGVSRWLEARAEREQRSLSQVKAELAHALSAPGVGRTILVVLDDIDRLSRNEIRLLFQLIKANADFPKMVYLVLFQRDIVERSLEERVENQVIIPGQEFLAKIVQAGFDLPMIGKEKIQELVEAHVNQTLSSEDARKHFDAGRWYDLWIPGLGPYFNTLRDAYRFVSSLRFHVGLLQHDGVLEVNPIDLIGLEVLRVFEPEVYHGLPTVKGELTNWADDFHGRRQDEEKSRQTLDSIVDKAPDTHRPSVRTILKSLFPPAERALGGQYSYTPESAEGWERELRVCCVDIFDRYFHLAVPEADVSQAEIERILSLTGDREGLAAELRALNERGLLGATLSRLEPYKQEISLGHAVPFLTALFDIGDELPQREPGLVSIGPAIHASRIVYWYLRQEDDPARRGEILCQAAEQTEGIYLLASLVSSECQRRERGKDPSEFLVDNANLDRLQRLCLAKIRGAAENGSLLRQPEMLSLLYDWRRWELEDAPSKWVQQTVRTDEGLKAFLVGLVQTGTSTGMGTYHITVRRYISLGNVDPFVQPEIIEDRLEELDETDLTEEEQLAVEEFRRALKRRKAGRDDNDWNHDGVD